MKTRNIAAFSLFYLQVKKLIVILQQNKISTITTNNNLSFMKNLLFALMLAFTANSMFAGNVQTASHNTELQSAKKKTTKRTTAQKTVRSPKNLVGNHMLSLQWISWKKFGKAVITKGAEEGTYYITGTQGSACCDEANGRNNGDYLSIEGTLRKIDDKHLVFNGKIITKVYHINGGQEVVREGEYNFLSTQGRKFWRMQEMQNPTGDGTDYVDIYF